MSAAVMQPVKLNKCHNVPFDRMNPEPPPFLRQLRRRGHWRRWSHAGTYRELSKAMRHAEHWLPANRGCVLDAGCGHSSDAYFAMKRWGFKEGIKVDLFPPYPDDPYFLDKMNECEHNKTRFIRGDICKLTDFIPPNSVDLIGCSAVLDLMDSADRNLFYSEAYEVLRPGGVLSVYWCFLVYGHHDWDKREELVDVALLNFEYVYVAHDWFVVRKPLAKEEPAPLSDDATGEGK